ncbi:hypothetical protein VRU48_15095 [Pedobacter sp. KR3-3]|uniref:SMI1/KNR4 family protein n=1 Tax=Pedobacter albus TaxID=3113905 RepID=A0ABU7IBA6_9SPHI|nr:hypothetical protein [Pedobacter sp. KR3-3]MEE1946449.1 hypothetical protein [Pedobacter sp. KR3-3]
MENLGRNSELYKILNTEISILSTQIEYINIYRGNNGLMIEVGIKLLGEKKGKRLKLICSGIREYAFYHSSNYAFYNIEEYKLIEKDGLYYICFDPEGDNMEAISADDNDFILCNSIEGALYG